MFTPRAKHRLKSGKEDVHWLDHADGRYKTLHDFDRPLTPFDDIGQEQLVGSSHA
ncbi:hypothetical protein GJ744_000080 [Endocarpon pusillum]|uniref:Uncharacterized protein n=1 Tax=Endocarpon pusillum TaxID=364733 RepID=A0A8H7B044_9EURO|nr:hypothetical protein GJ744_000080 [Endocarpon pusillum]